jgi:hypothetical protein
MPVPGTGNAANAFPITAKAAKYRDASFPHPVKKVMTGLLRIYTKITKRIVKAY